jgi:hypothetical protein
MASPRKRCICHPRTPIRVTAKSAKSTGLMSPVA